MAILSLGAYCIRSGTTRFVVLPVVDFFHGADQIRSRSISSVNHLDSTVLRYNETPKNTRIWTQN